MASPRTRAFTHDGHRLVYDELGDGPHTIVLVHGLLLSRRMHRPLGEALAAAGNRVILLDLLGHGESDRPREMWRYSMPAFGEQVVALLDHLELDEAVVLGTSLGANVALEIAAAAPGRLRGMVVEMPVLDNALLACAIVFAPMLVGLTFGAPLARAVGRLARLVPDDVHPLVDTFVGTLRQDPGPSSAVLQGLFFGRIAPPRAERSEIRTRALVLGHRRDPVHPFSDSDMLIGELRDARLVQAGSILELRLQPERLTAVITGFVEQCWNQPASARRRRATRPRAVAGGAAARR